jgi:hypothetical protein
MYPPTGTVQTLTFQPSESTPVTEGSSPIVVLHSWGSELLEWAAKNPRPERAVYMYQESLTAMIQTPTIEDFREAVRLLSAGEVVGVKLNVLYGESVRRGDTKRRKGSQNVKEIGRLDAQRNARDLTMYATEMKIKNGVASLLLTGLPDTNDIMVKPMIYVRAYLKDGRGCRASMARPSQRAGSILSRKGEW